MQIIAPAFPFSHHGFEFKPSESVASAGIVQKGRACLRIIAIGFYGFKMARLD
jgi:hypothetical protein